jgi:tRNA(Ile)-lysidine synthase
VLAHAGLVGPGGPVGAGGPLGPGGPVGPAVPPGPVEPLAEVRRALAAVRAPGSEPAPDDVGPLLVALSGGRDSLVLLHILRFHLPHPSGVAAVHVDHAMRAGSAADARWIAGLCRAWGVPLRVVRLDPAPRSEAAARARRYRVLRDQARSCGARRVLVAHHSDDQAETILFRILRGTGPRGLAGIPACRRLDRGPDPIVLLRPLLRVPGEQVEQWARAAGLRPREDPTNRELRYRRNRIRHHLLPKLEAASPGFRADLLALGDAARGREQALEQILRPAVDDVVLVREPDRISFARKRFLRYPEAVRAELLRRLVREGGGSMGRKGLALALGFAASSESGRSVTAGPGVRLTRDFDKLVLNFGSARVAPASRVAPESVRLEGVRGEGRFAPRAGHPVRVWWRVGEAGEDSSQVPADPTPARVPGGHRTTFPFALVEAPLEVRGRRPGDRVRLHLGTGPEGGPPRLRKLKKLLGEARVSRDTRDNLALLVDARGWVIWIPGVWRTRVPTPGADPRTWTIGVIDANNFA